MVKAANDDVLIPDADDREIAADRAHVTKIKQDAAVFRGRSDLIQLSLAVCRELRVAEGEFVVNASERKNVSETERVLLLRSAEPILARMRAKSDELETLLEAMDQSTRQRFWAAVDETPSAW